MALGPRAVVVKPGSENQMPGSSLRHGSAETPPSTIGTSTEDPLRLSVIVIDSGMSPPQGSERGIRRAGARRLGCYLRHGVHATLGRFARHVGRSWLYR